MIDGNIVGDTKQCVHCGGHFLSVRGSGKIRGWCLSCVGITCGGAECRQCIPFEKKLELYEKGQLKVLR